MKGAGVSVDYPLDHDLENSFVMRLALGYQANLTENLTLNTEAHFGIEINTGEATAGIGMGIGYRF